MKDEPTIKWDEAKIQKSIDAWKEISHDGTALVSYLNQGDCFMYTYYDVHQSHDIHAYPGIYDDKLYFFVIPAAFDKVEYKDTFSQYTLPCPVMPTPLAGSHTIDSYDAMLRINRWRNTYTGWVPEQANTEQGIFLAFNISVADIEVPQVLINLALKLHPENQSWFTADLIVTNRTETKVYFDDFVKSVPPYSATLTPESFYLLQIA